MRPTEPGSTSRANTDAGTEGLVPRKTKEGSLLSRQKISDRELVKEKGQESKSGGSSTS